MEFRMHGAWAILERAREAEVLREQVEALEEALLSRPSLVFDLAKSIVETTCKTILADRGIEVEEAISCPKLVKRTAATLKLIPQDHRAASREGVKEIINGLVTAVNGLCVVRNNVGAASHGRDAFSKRLGPVQALLAARAADAVISFLWEVHGRDQADVLEQRLLYENQVEFNDWVDSQYEGPIEIMGTMLRHSEVLFNSDRIAYKNALLEFEDGYWLEDAPEDAED